MLLYHHFIGLKIFNFEEIVGWTHFRLINRSTVKPIDFKNARVQEGALVLHITFFALIGQSC